MQLNPENDLTDGTDSPKRFAAQSMLAWPHSGFHVHDGVWVPDGDMDFESRDPGVTMKEEAE
ncbi:MAG: hypothetical protein H0U13_11425 [Gemmatimonadaceae bacterium]|nr:hypothetical protein [Gemmatimonadaceae bacterium]